MNTYVVGIDAGSTSLKLLVATPAGQEVLVASRRTPWTNLEHGQAQMSAERVIAVVHELAAEADGLLRRDGAYRVAAIAVSGMAEAAVVLDSAGDPAAEIMAWFDPRGGAEIVQTPARFRDEFRGRTGLPVGPLATIAKLLHLRGRGVDLRGTTFLNVPEFIMHSLGGPRVSEYSLASRTGLLDQDDATPWTEALDVLGVSERIMADRVNAGTPVGNVTDPDLPDGFRGAALAVAGHDHLVSAVATGATDSRQLYDSIGTAEALVRVLDGPLPFDARERLATAGINTVRHVVPGKHVLLAGTKAGLLMRRTLQLLGIRDEAGRKALDDRVMALPAVGGVGAGGLSVSGARNDDGVLRVIANTDGLSPEELFVANLLHGNDMCAELMDVMDREVPAPTSTIMTGGWALMRSVVRARELILPPATVTIHDEATAYGAALFAAFAASGGGDFPPFAATFRAGAQEGPTP